MCAVVTNKVNRIPETAAGNNEKTVSSRREKKGWRSSEYCDCFVIAIQIWGEHFLLARDDDEVK